MSDYLLRDEWSRSYRSIDGATNIEHRDGVQWFEAEVPPVDHECAVQTRGWVRDVAPVLRCACGAISSDGRQWDERNSREGAVR